MAARSGLADAGVLRRLAALASSGLSAADAELGQEVLARIPAFRATQNPDIVPELAAHAAEHSTELVRLLNGGAIGDFEFVARHARRRAAQHFPLEATLHAYRCGHRHYVSRLRDMLAQRHGPPDTRALTAIADFALEYTDAVSTVAAREYVRESARLVEIEAGQRSRLLDILLAGHDESDGQTAGILRQAGYLDRRRAYCVVVARPVDVAEMENPARVRRLVAALGAELDRHGWRTLVGAREDRVVAIVSHVRRQSGWSAPQAALASRVLAALRGIGPAVLIGVSNDAPATAHVPAALRQADFALQTASVESRTRAFGEIPLPDIANLLLGDALAALLPPWIAEFRRADRRGNLAATAQAYADADMNVLRAAKRLGVHPNTLYARFERIAAISGLDPRSYKALGELLLALRHG